MNEFLRERILRKLDTLSDERGYQVLDYVEFLESRYAERQAPSANVFSRLAEGVEDTLRSAKVSPSTIATAMGFMGQAMSALNGVAAAGRSVASDIVNAAKAPMDTPAAPGNPPAGASSSTTQAPPPSTSGERPE